MERDAPRSISQKTANTAICAALALILFFTLGSALEIRRQALWEREAEERRMQCLLLSQELAGISDGLTADFQRFVMTGDYTYMESYWTEVNTGRNREAVMDALAQYDLPEQEIKLMHRAFSNSRLLTDTETRVMRLAMDAFDPGDYGIPEEVSGYVLNIVEKEMDTAERLDWARSLAFGAEYAAEKAVITGSVQSFQQVLTERLDGELLAASAATRRAINRQIVLLVITGGLLAAIWAIYSRLTLLPIRRYTESLKEMEGRPGDVLEPQGSRELRLLADKFNLAYRELAAAGEAKSRFFSTMSHELRTPLHALVQGQTLLAGTELDDEQARYVDVLGSACRAMLDTVNHILDLSKLESGKYRLVETTVEVREIFRDLEAIFTPLAQEKEIDFRLEVGDTVPELLYLDRTALYQVASNLISNAVKFTRSGEVSVRADYSPKSQVLTLRVADTGPGIRTGDRERIFRQFEQTETARAHTGTGLGLSICRELAEAMGGELLLESEWGRGSVFTARLPVVAGVAGSGRSGERAPDLSPLRDLRVLLVEDNALSREMGSELLTRMGLRVTAVETGPQAVAHARAGHYAVILMDLRMAPWDGFQTAERLRAEGLVRDTALIALTADGELSTRERARASGIGYYLAKPLDTGRLTALLLGILGQRQGPPPEPPHNPPPEVPLLDHAGALARLGGDEALYARLLRQFTARHGAELDGLPGILPGGETDQKRAVHTLRGLALAVGAEALASALAQLESSGGSAEAIPPLYRRTAAEIALWLRGAPGEGRPGEAGDIRDFLDCLARSDVRAKALFSGVAEHYRRVLSPEQYGALERAVMGFRFELARDIIRGEG